MTFAGLILFWVFISSSANLPPSLFDFLGFSDIFPPGRADLPHGDLRHPLPDHGGQVPTAEDTLWRLSSETRLSLTDAQNGKYQLPYFQLERTAGPAGVRAPEYDNPAYQVEQSMMIQSVVITSMITRQCQVERKTFECFPV